MYAVGATHAGVENLRRYLLGQLVVSAIQVTAQLVNEYADIEPDRTVEHRTLFSGGSGVLVDGRLAPRVALWAGFTTTGLALAGIVALMRFSPLASAVAGVALVIAWGYSIPPLRLLETGWGELITAVVVGGMVPVVGALANGGSIDVQLAWLIGALVSVNLAVILAFELPDLESDRSAGKTVLAVRVGRTATIRLLAVCLVTAAVVTVAGIAWGGIQGGWFLAGALVPAGLTVRAAIRSQHALLTASAVATVASFGLLLLGRS